MITSWHSYPKIWNLGHKNILNIFEDAVLIEEKVDGSQISFGRFDGELKVKSKGAIVNTEFPEGMFSLAVENIKTLDLHDGWTYRGEYLAKPKHNILCYDRVPVKNIVIFDINTSEEEYLTATRKLIEAQRIGLECVPCFKYVKVENVDSLLKLLETKSFLGGQKIEGFVVKNYAKFTEDKKVMMGKYVSEAFKEIHSQEWKNANPGTVGIIENLVEKYRTPARWDKAIIHLKEKMVLENSPKDIGMLLKEVGDDIKTECIEEIKNDLFLWAWPKIKRGCMAGFAEHYKEKLLRDSFGENIPEIYKDKKWNTK